MKELYLKAEAVITDPLFFVLVVLTPHPKGDHMRLIAFPQWDKLTSLLRGMARQSAADFAQRNIVRIIPKNGIAHLANYAANLLAVEGGKTTIIMPDIP